MPGTSMPEAPLMPVPDMAHGALALPPAAPGPALERALRHARGTGAGRVVLRVEEAAPHRRRLARALLQEGALAAGGQVMEGPGGDLLLVGADPGRAERLRGLLERLVGPDGALLWSLERDAEALLAYAAGGTPPVPRLPDQGPALAGLDAFLESLPLSRAVRRLHGIAPGAGAGARPAFLRLEPARAEVASALGALGADPDLLDHALRRITARLHAALADPAEARALLGPMFGPPGAPRLHLPLPALPPGTGRLPPGMLVATLPLTAAAEPEALASRVAALAEAGIGIEMDGLDAAALALLDPAALPAATLRLHWSPALGALPVAALRRLDPARLILAGATGGQALRFAEWLGIPLIEAPAA